ncbi:hypothetical protein HDEF_1617 [Candidatus Hamiltonella defensa 5AT (Acyrthosiphon pisum)]|uniref:Uncharacterized protein n=1 Tax=Hamiltonella defensa subsp. Acyrthosiphon pisum (strain 5AT) TaxID=572265 RepID=C4K6N6_HAMD5|nr:hypothetical protein HDEF_1617 [Candidatus Hamiltonella defensa 5AT (Acyrthosiphon pisum)]
MFTLSEPSQANRHFRPVSEESRHKLKILLITTAGVYGNNTC